MDTEMSLDLLLKEVDGLRSLLNIEPVRRLPTRVKYVTRPMSVHSTSSARDGVLFISKEARRFEESILKKEALSLFIHPKVDELVPQVHDLAWVYSRVPKEAWMNARIPPPARFSYYDPYDLLMSSESDSKSLIAAVLPILNASSIMGELDFPTYLSILNRALIESLELNRTERKVLEILSKEPHLRIRHLSYRLGTVESTASRIVKKLRRLGILFGPEIVNIRKLGLETLLVEIPNRRELREIFWDFPFTYNLVVPVSRRLPALAILTVPRDSAHDMVEELSRLGMVVYQARFSFRSLSAPRDSYQGVARNLLTQVDLRGSICESRDGETIRLSRSDLKILNEILREGRVTLSRLREMGFKTGRKLQRLRRFGLLVRGYHIEMPRGLEALFIRVRCTQDDFRRVAALVSSVSMASLSSVASEKTGFEGCMGVIHPRREDTPILIRELSAILGDRLEVCTPILHANSLWTIPEDLWDETHQRFRWREALDELVSRIGSLEVAGP